LSTCVGFQYGFFTDISYFLKIFKDFYFITIKLKIIFIFCHLSLLNIIYNNYNPLNKINFRFTLRDRFTQRGLAFLWKPWTLGDNVFYTLLIATHINIFNSDFSNLCHHKSSLIYRTFCYHLKIWFLNLSFRQVILVPLHFQCKKAKPVSYYAFFKGWLLPSLPTGCFQFLTNFSLN